VAAAREHGQEQKQATIAMTMVKAPDAIRTSTSQSWRRRNCNGAGMLKIG
jgi:hypothetical protein